MTRLQRFLSALWSIALWNGAPVHSQRHQVVQTSIAHRRHLEPGNYHSLTSTELGLPNPEAAIGNPLKGLLPSPQYSRPPYTPNLPHSLEFFYIGLKQVMVGDPNILDEGSVFNWTAVEQILAGTTSRSTHAILRFYVVYPGRQLEVPQYMIDAGIELRNYTEGSWINEQSPYFDNAIFLEGLERFVLAFGRKYDGDVRIAYIQAGLLGFWGEWHSMGKGFLPDHVEVLAVGWFDRSFFQTEVQFRYPSAAVRQAGFGLHDDSFAYETLDGVDNGGFFRSYYFYQRVLRQGMVDSWKTSVIGGETRGEISHELFKPTYNASTWQRQDFMRCVNETRATYMFQHGAFETPFLVGTELTNAQFAHARMGYNFYVPNVSVRNSTLDGQVDVSVTIIQIGIAPYYYDLDLAFQCSGMTKRNLSGVEKLIEQGDAKVFVFIGIPATSACMRAVSLSLESSYAMLGRPIKFAQGSGSLVFGLPLPGAATHAPTLPPTQAPTNAPVSFAPTYGELAATKLTLINADTDVDIVRMTNRMVINLFQQRNLNIRADPVSSFRTRSIEFKLDGAIFRIENGAPYALNGNSGPDYFAWTPSPGTHVIEVTPYTNTSATGVAGAKVKILFTVVSVPPTLRPTKAPTIAPRSKEPIFERPPEAPTTAPPTKLPVTALPTKAPITSSPTKPPNTTPTSAPMSPSPTKTPIISLPTQAPITGQPTGSPIKLASTPTKAPVTALPTKAPITSSPTKPPTTTPTYGPMSPSPTKTPKAPVTALPTKAPITSSPTKPPTTVLPTYAPISRSPTKTPNATPSKAPITSLPTKAPITGQPTGSPIKSTAAPITAHVTKSPVTTVPSKGPITVLQTNAPVTSAPTKTPVMVLPTIGPVTLSPKSAPTKLPVEQPTKAPTGAPSDSPIKPPTSTQPIAMPVSKSPTHDPTKAPTTALPTKAPITPKPTQALVTVSPTLAPITSRPTLSPMKQTNAPITVRPMKSPTRAPMMNTSKGPTRSPVISPVIKSPISSPVKQPSKSPTKLPTKVIAPTKTPVRASQGVIPSVVNLSLFNADSDRRLLSLTNGTKLSRSALKTRNFSIEASITQSHNLGKVVFAVNSNPNFFTESQAPYTIAGDDSSGNYYAWTPMLGKYTVSATPYSRNGRKGTPRTVTFEVVQ